MDCKNKHEFESSMGRFYENLFLVQFAHNIVFDQVKVCLLLLWHLPDSKLSLFFGVCIKITLENKIFSLI